MRLRIVVIGAGAMGSLFGGHLHASGHDVTLVTSNVAHVTAVNRDGLEIRSSGSRLRVTPKAVLKPLSGDPADLLIMSVKAYKTAEAIRESRSLVGPETRLLTLQNGLDNAEMIAQTVGEAGRILAGATYEGAVLEAPGRVRHSGGGWTVLSPWGPKGARAMDGARAVAALLTEAGLEAQAVPDAKSVIWCKVAVNAAINPVTALLGVENGAIAELPMLQPVMEAVIGETLSVARSEGVELREGLLEEVLRVARATARNRSSMLRDLDLARPTEIMSLNGAIARKGEKSGIPTPVNRTLTHLVRARERITRKLLEASLDN